MVAPLLPHLSEPVVCEPVPPSDRLRIYECRCGVIFAAKPPRPDQVTPQWCNGCLRRLYHLLKYGGMPDFEHEEEKAR